MSLYRIALDEIAANLFIEISRRNPGLNLRSVFVSYKELERYAENVTAYLAGQNIRYITCFGRDNTAQVLHEYSRFFVEVKQLIASSEYTCYGLMGGPMCTHNNLIECFHRFVDVDLLNAYTTVSRNMSEINFKIIE